MSRFCFIWVNEMVTTKMFRCVSSRCTPNIFERIGVWKQRGAPKTKIKGRKQKENEVLVKKAPYFCIVITTQTRRKLADE